MGDHVRVPRRNITLSRQVPRGTVRVSRNVGVCLLMVAAFGYCGWALEFLLPTQLPAAGSYIVELSAADRPHSTLFRAIDFGTGAAALGATPFLGRLVPVQLLRRLTVTTVGVFGVLMLLRGGMILDCAPSVSQACVSRQARGAGPAAHSAARVLSVAGRAALGATPFLGRLVPVQLLPRLTVTTVGVFGVLMLLRGGMILDCAPSVSQACVSRQARDAVSAAHSTGWVLTIAVHALFLLGVASAERWFARGFWRNGMRLALALMVLTGVAVLLSVTLGGGDYVGVLVRVQTFVQAATLFLGAVYLLSLARAR